MTAETSGPRASGIGRVTSALVGLSLLLLPFSTGHGRQVGGAPPGTEALIIPYALPRLGLAAASTIAALLLGARRLPSSVRYAVALGAAYSAVVCAFSLYSPSLAGFAYRILPTLLGFTLFLNVLSIAGMPRGQARPEAGHITNWLVASGAVLGAYYVVNFVVQTLIHGIVPVLLSRTVGGLASLPWHASNVVAGVILYPLFVALARTHEMERVPRLFVLAILVMIGGVLLTMSKGAIGCMLVVLVVHALLLRSVRGRLLMAAAAAGAVAVLYVALGDAFGTFFEVTTGTLGGDWSDGRMERVADAIGYYLRRPWEPVGFADSGTVIAGGAHNIWTAHLVESGLAGVLTFGGMIGLILVRSVLGALLGHAADRRTALAYLAGLAGVLAHMMVETPIYTWQGSIYFWVFAGLVTVHAELVSSARRAAHLADGRPTFRQRGLLA